MSLSMNFPCFEKNAQIMWIYFDWFQMSIIQIEGALYKRKITWVAKKRDSSREPACNVYEESDSCSIWRLENEKKISCYLILS